MSWFPVDRKLCNQIFILNFSLGIEVSIEEPIEPSLKLRFQTERLSRTITDCRDIEILRAIAMELLQLHQSNSALADWATRRAAEAEHRSVNLTNFLETEVEK